MKQISHEYSFPPSPVTVLCSPFCAQLIPALLSSTKTRLPLITALAILRQSIDCQIIDIYIYHEQFVLQKVVLLTE